MRRYCHVLFCESFRDEGAGKPNLCFSRLPRDALVREKWLKNLTFTPRVLEMQNINVCELHFDPTNVIRSNIGKVTLLPGALPIIDGFELNRIRGKSSKLVNPFVAAKSFKNVNNRDVMDYSHLLSD